MLPLQKYILYVLNLVETVPSEDIQADVIS